VTCQHLALSQRYIQYVHIGTEKRGTAILVKVEIPLTDIKCLPSGRGITIKYKGISVINIYAPSGAEKKQNRDVFYNNDVPYLLPGHNTDTILAGDFNCVLSSDDATEQRNYSCALEKLVSGLKLHDIGTQTSAGTAVTHYTPRGASRIDRIYISATS
jgi:exonuclease III